MRMRTLAAAFTALGLAGGAVVLAQRTADPQKGRRLVGISSREEVVQAQGTVERRSVPLPAKASATRLPSPGEPSPSPLTPPPAAALSAPPPGPDEPIPTPTPQPVEDPIQDVDAFVAEGHRKADDTIKRLSQEAASLRARLQKVEMALERWKAVAEALEARPDQSRRKLLPADDAATDLSPVPVESTPK